jgi:thiol-disulfide isomerase/thioredoxin
MCGFRAIAFLIALLAGNASGQQEISAVPVAPAAPPEGGVRVSEEQTRAYAVGTSIPQRVPVRPDDPNSAMWEVDPRVAFAQAQREQKPLLLLFTADWNAKCLKLSEEVFSTKSFNEFARETAVICYLNFPRNQTDAPDLVREWKDRFKVMGFPNLLIFSPDGLVAREIGGYTVGKPATYFNQLKETTLPLVAEIEEKKATLRRKGYRNWKNKDGKILFAAFVRHGGGLVTLRGANEAQWTIETATLSPEDRQFVESFPASVPGR